MKSMCFVISLLLSFTLFGSNDSAPNELTEMLTSHIENKHSDYETEPMHHTYDEKGLLLSIDCTVKTTQGSFWHICFANYNRKGHLIAADCR